MHLLSINFISLNLFISLFRHLKCFAAPKEILIRRNFGYTLGDLLPFNFAKDELLFPMFMKKSHALQEGYVS